MRVSLRSVGGFTGPAGAVTRTIDVDALPNDRKAKALEVINAARVFERPAKIMLEHPRPWDFQHVLEVDDGPRSRRIVLHEAAADDSLRELLDWIQEESEP
jgi:hypothetical protein